MKIISILGATGSVGLNTLKLLKLNENKFRVQALTANKDYKKLAYFAKAFRAKYAVIGDDNLILGHRTSEWCGHAPTLEEDLALPNIALDLIGHAQSLYSLAIQLKSDYKHEDQLAFLRLEHQYKNLLLVEQENGHFGNTILRLFYFSTYMKYFWEQVSINCFFKKLKEFSEKAFLETSYHSKYSSQWVITLGDGTEESNKKMLEAVSNMEPFIGELFDIEAIGPHYFMYKKI